MERNEQALLITGVFGAGKSSVAEEIADILEKRGAPYAVLDLDWLAWFGPEDEDAQHRILLQNLASVVGNYRAAGVRCSFSPMPYLMRRNCRISRPHFACRSRLLV